MSSTKYYHLLTVDSDGSVYVADDVLDGLEGAQHLALEHALSVMAGHEVERCDCGLGLTIRLRGERQRFVHLLPVESVVEESESGIEDLALALGVLTPASRADGRLEVGV